MGHPCFVVASSRQFPKVGSVSESALSPHSIFYLRRSKSRGRFWVIDYHTPSVQWGLVSQRNDPLGAGNTRGQDQGVATSMAGPSVQPNRGARSSVC